jgi:uncharacterized membrane protein
MRGRIFSVICGLLFLVGRGGAVQSFSYQAIDVPCSACPGGIALRTAPEGISAVGEIVGGFTDAVGGQHGFLLSRGRFTSIDVPGSLVGVAGTLPTTPDGINPAGDIVGQFTAPYNPPASTTAAIDDARYCPAANSPACIKGFLYRRGVFSTVLFPGHPGAWPQRITPDGDIYGCLHDYDLMRSMFGAVWTRFGDSSLTAGGGELIDPTKSFPSSMNNGATPGGGVIVGLWDDMNTPSHRHGFVVQNGQFQSYDVPSTTITLTAIWDINPSGQFVGTYVDATGRHGFEQNPDGSAPIQLDVPGGANTIAFGINPQGMIVGDYTVSGKVHGFVAAPAAE